MAYLNNIWFENDIAMHGKPGDICIESGYKAELTAARHMPPRPGVYWLNINSHTRQQTTIYGRSHHWQLVKVSGRTNGQLREIDCAFGNHIELDWYDFTNAHWRGPVEMPTPPDDEPETAADRL